MAKAFGIAGLRIGYGISNEEIIKFLHKVKAPFNVNFMAQEAALSSLDDIQSMKEKVQKILKNKEELIKILDKKFKTFESWTNFVLVDVSPYTAKEFYDKLYEKGIIIRPFGKFENFEGEYVRITVGTEEENEALINAIEEIF